MIVIDPLDDPLDGADHISATRGDGYPFVYSAQRRKLAVRPDKLSGGRPRGWWYNPRSGAAKAIGEFDNVQTREITPPSEAFGSDWVLAQNDASRSFAAPGTRTGTVRRQARDGHAASHPVGAQKVQSSDPGGPAIQDRGLVQVPTPLSGVIKLSYPAPSRSFPAGRRSPLVSKRPERPAETVIRKTIQADEDIGDALMTSFIDRPPDPWALSLVPPFPAIAHRILALASQEHVGAYDVGAVIKLDPSFSAEVLSFANSALFGARCRITSLTQAVALLGMNRVKSMATFVAVNNMVRSSARASDLRKVWVRSVVTAIIAEEAASICRLDSEFAYTAGLLHNLGALGLMSTYADEYSRMLGVSNEFGFDLLQTERDLFDIDHCAAGAYLARDWSFPDKLADAIAAHHDEPVAKERSVDNFVKLSWRLTDTLGYAAFAPDKEWDFEDLAAYLPPGANSWLGESAESVKAEIDTRLAASPI